MFILRDQDGDIHTVGGNETLATIWDGDAYYILRVSLQGESDNGVIVFRGTRGEAQVAMELVWEKLTCDVSVFEPGRRPPPPVVDFTEHRTELWEQTQEPKKSTHLKVVPLRKGDGDE